MTIILLSIFVIIALGFALFLIVFRVKSINWATISALTSPLQIHTIPIASIFPSLSFLTGLASVKSIYTINKYGFFWLYCFIFLEFFRAISIFWSPNIAYGIRNVAYELIFLFILLAFADVKQNAKFKEKIITYTLVLSGVNALLVILFRLFPEIEGQFLHSFWVRLFISPNVLDGLFTFNPNNVLDPSKSGGLFVNANVSASYLGLSSMAAIYFGRAFESRKLTLIGFFIWISVFFTGSKSAAIIAILLPISISYLHLLISSGLTLRNITLIFWLTLLISLFAFFITFYSKDSAFLNDTTSTLHTRFIIWEFAWISFLKHPLLGLGFGGWENGMASFAYLNGFRNTLPAHNAILILWNQSGLPAAICGVLFVTTLIASIIKAMKFSSGSKLLILKGILAGFLWVCVQAMGENFGIIGEAHITPLLAMLVGYAISVGCFDFPDKSTRNTRSVLRGNS